MELSLKNLGIIRDALMSYTASIRSQYGIILEAPERITYEEFMCVSEALKRRISETESLQEQIEILINKH